MTAGIEAVRRLLQDARQEAQGYLIDHPVATADEIELYVRSQFGPDAPCGRAARWAKDRQIADAEAYREARRRRRQSKPDADEDDVFKGQQTGLPWGWAGFWTLAAIRVLRER